MTVVYVTLAVILGIIVMTLCLLLCKAGVQIQLRREKTFSYEIFVQYGIIKVNIKKILKKKKKKPDLKKTEEKEEGQKKKEKKASLTPLIQPGIQIGRSLWKVVQKHLVVQRLDMRWLVALKDPMATGMAYGVGQFLQGTGIQILQQNLKVKNHSVSIAANFEEGSGIYFWICTKLYIRPLIFLVSLLMEYWKNARTKEAEAQVLRYFNKKEKGS